MFKKNYIVVLLCIQFSSSVFASQESPSFFSKFLCFIGIKCEKINSSENNNKKKSPISLSCPERKNEDFINCLKQQSTLDLALRNDRFLHDQLENDEKLQQLFNTDPEYKKLIQQISLDLLYKSDSGVKEGYTVGEHSVRALVVFETQKKFFTRLDEIKPHFIQNNYNFLKYLVAYHDIGKSISIKTVGNNSEEIAYSYPITWRLMNNSGFNKEESQFAISLIALHKIIGSYLQNRTEFSTFVSEVRRYSKFNSISDEVFFYYLQILYIADAGSYPYLQKVVFNINPQSNEMTIKSSPRYEELVQKFNIK